jgi:glyoxylase-like metal-dependent hydrolase (beta-lactamase superfamily II)
MTETSHTFGPYSVTLLQDGVFEPPNDILIHAGGAEALAAAKAGLGETLHLQVNAFLVQGPGGVTLVDAGIGQAWGPGFGHARGLLAAAGIAPAAIDRVLLTHLHADHAMGLLDGDQAWLENAEIMVPALDMDYFSDDAVRASLPEAKHNAFDMTKTLLTAYAGRLRRIGPGPVPGMPGVELVALPGHTPGHSGYRFHGDGDLLLWADTLHVRDAPTRILGWCSTSTRRWRARPASPHWLPRRMRAGRSPSPMSPALARSCGPAARTRSPRSDRAA